MVPVPSPLLSSCFVVRRSLSSPILLDFTHLTGTKAVPQYYSFAACLCTRVLPSFTHPSPPPLPYFLFVSRVSSDGIITPLHISGQRPQKSLSHTWHDNPSIDMATLSVPSPDMSPASLGNTVHRPLSTHGLPKPPRTMSPERPHRFSAKSFPPPTLAHTPMTPDMSGPMSPPPMSAKSFGTFIDSEPSTPAYSPRIGTEWNNSSVLLVRPTSSSSEPASPGEPVWRMLKPLPVKAPPKPKQKPTSVVSQSMASAVGTKEVSSNMSLYSHHTKEARHISRPTEFKLADLSQQNYPPKCEDIELSADEKPGEQNGGTPTSAAFGRLASKMKLMLRRKNNDTKKKEKKQRHYEEVDRIEDKHWTEM